MKILFVTPQCPSPPTKGTTLRNFHLIRGAAQHHEVGLVTILAPGETEAQLGPLREWGIQVWSAPQPQWTAKRRLATLLTSGQPDLARRLRSDGSARAFREAALSFRPDVIQFEAVEAVGACGPLGPVFQQIGYRPRLLYDAHNAEYALQRTVCLTDARHPPRWPKALYSLIQWRRLKRYEMLLVSAFDGVVAVSPGDSDEMRSLGARAVHIVPNGVDTGYYAYREMQPDSAAPLLVFVGTLDFRPNVDALQWFVTQSLPLVLRRYPAARLAIVGRTPAPAVAALAGPNVEVVGPVDDERVWLERAAVYVVPLRMGGGMRFKVVQAMSAGVPIVSTTLGAEGVAVEHGVHLLLADDPADFAGQIAETIANRPATATRVNRSRQLAETTYSWDVILPEMERCYQSLQSRRAVER